MVACEEKEKGGVISLLFNSSCYLGRFSASQ
jgi:hypothetical protein